MSDARIAAAAVRNRESILAVLQRVLPTRGTVLEIASGSGTHAAYFAAALPHLTWQPTDQDAAEMQSIGAWRTTANRTNLLAPLVLDVTSQPWPVARADAVVCINMIHISPWRSTEALMAGAGRVLSAGGVLFLYGPYKESGRHTAPSNEAFDADLRARNPEWGVRDLDDVKAEADRHGFDFVERVPMPANNLSVVFRKR